MKTTDAGANWASISLGGASSPFGSIFDIEMQNANVGFIVGDRSLGKTTDGGNSWTSLIGYIPPINSSYIYQFMGVTFPSTNLGWIAGGKSVSSNNIGSIFSTEDGGNTWRTENVPDTKLFLDLFFVDNKNGWAVGENGPIYKHSFNKFCLSNTIVITANPTNNNPLTLTGTATSGSQATANTITSTQTINNGVNVRYTSGKSISLEPTFKADTGSVFKAQIGGACN